MKKKLTELERRLFENRFIRRLELITPIMIYQMGKVGSSSIYHSLKKVYPGVVLQTHSFGLDNPNWKVRRLSEMCQLKGKSLNVITPIREPVSRNMSAFFQNIERDTGVPLIGSNSSILELQKEYFNNFDHQLPLKWFDMNIEANFGIDVYATPFPDNGWAIYQNKNIRLLIIRSEIDDTRKIEAISAYLGIQDFKLIVRNISINKPYADVYRQFRESVILPPWYVKEMCDSKYFNHFYSKEFIEETKAKWKIVVQSRIDSSGSKIS